MCICFFCLHVQILNACSVYRDAQGLQLHRVISCQCRCQELNIGPLEKQAGHLTALSAIQPVVGYFYSLGTHHQAPI